MMILSVGDLGFSSSIPPEFHSPNYGPSIINRCLTERYYDRNIRIPVNRRGDVVISWMLRILAGVIDAVVFPGAASPSEK